MKEHVGRKKHRTHKSEETEAIFYTFFENLDINAQLLDGKELKKIQEAMGKHIYAPRCRSQPG